MDSVVITPEPGRHKEIGKQLLELASSPRDVQWVTWPKAGYAVPVELFAKFATAGEDKTEPETAEPEAVAEVPAKRRGRPRKDSSTDNNSEEE